MDHVVISLDRDHVDALSRLALGAAAAAGVAAPSAAVTCPHVTLAAHWGLAPSTLRRAVEGVAATTAPFVIHAHGYGFFIGDEAFEINLHVPVVRSAPLERLHREICAAVCRAGGTVARWSEADLWSPHITLLDRSLEASTLGRAATWLARRHHPSWRIPVDHLSLVGGWPDRGRQSETLSLEGRTPAA